jgi:hypothetical protein
MSLLWLLLFIARMLPCSLLSRLPRNAMLYGMPWSIANADGQTRRRRGRRFQNRRGQMHRRPRPYLRQKTTTRTKGPSRGSSGRLVPICNRPSPTKVVGIRGASDRLDAHYRILLLLLAPEMKRRRVSERSPTSTKI